MNRKHSPTSPAVIASATAPAAGLLGEPALLPPILFSEREAAKMLCICAKSLYNLRQASRITFRKIGTRICYAPHDLTSFIESVKVESGGK